MSPQIAARDLILPHVIKWEGRKVVDHPSDPGGITKFGISLKFAGSIDLDLDGDGATTREDILLVTEDVARVLYIEHFWKPSHCDDMPAPLALCVFDSAVNQGVHAAAVMLQKALGCYPDGIIGPKTLRALHGVNDLRWLIVKFMGHRAMRYAFTRNVITFGAGWFNRLMDTLFEAAILSRA